MAQRVDIFVSSDIHNRKINGPIAFFRIIASWLVYFECSTLHLLLLILATELKTEESVIDLSFIFAKLPNQRKHDFIQFDELSCQLYPSSTKTKSKKSFLCSCNVEPNIIVFTWNEGRNHAIIPTCFAPKKGWVYLSYRIKCLHKHCLIPTHTMGKTWDSTLLRSKAPVWLGVS